jgi:lysophospholipase
LAQPAPLLGVDDAPVPKGATAEWFAGAGGARLRAALFPASGEPKGSVVVSPGRTEPIEKYFEVVGELAGRGFVALVHDWRGQGLSERLTQERLKGHAIGYRDFLVDWDALILAFETRLPKPWIALGHSMGGCLTALALAGGERRFAAAAFSAPMFGVFTHPLPPALASWLARGLTAAGAGAALVPGAGLKTPPATFEANVLTHDARRYARNLAQVARCPELGLGPPTWGWLDFALSAIGELREGPGLPKADIPAVVVAAAEDRLVDNRRLREVTARMPKAEYVEIPGAYHEILQETDDIRALFWRRFDALTERALG